MPERRPRIKAFTLIELMIVVAIIALLATAAIPAFIKYVRRSKTTEATMNVRRLYDSSVSYFESERAGRGVTGVMIYRQFPSSTGLKPPPQDKCCKRPGGKCRAQSDLWKGPGNETWQGLNFAVDNDPFYFQYQYTSTGTESTSSFTAGVYGDLDCNDTYSTYERTGRVDSAFNVQGAGGLYIFNDIE